ncbi:MAG TPA: nucleotidyltransferase domain-containing protein [Ktedonobacterales bacterium]|nr:nucleotidyltransferase domain-containing protein [Ktedonobacterales bacterium]
MGNKLTKSTNHRGGNCPSWLDHASADLVNDIVRVLSAKRPDLLAILLYGSVARQEERPIEDQSPSDVDLLAIFDSDDEAIAIHQGKALFALLGEAYNWHLDVPRDVKVMFASRTLAEWDASFIAHVAQDAIVLWARGPLPASLAEAGEHTAQATDLA